MSFAFTVACALATVSAAPASASAPELVTNPGQTFPVSIGNSLHAGSVSFDSRAMPLGLCTENRTEGTITGPKTVSLTLEWTGCSTGSAEWHSEGSPEGHVVLTGTGTLSYIARSTEQVGIVFAIKEVKIISGTTSIKLRGSLVIPITPLNKETNKFALPVHEKSLGEQEIRSYENENREVVAARPEIDFGTGFKEAGIEVQGANELTTNKSLTIKTPPPPPHPEFILGEGESYPVALEGSYPAAKVSLANAAAIVGCEGASTKGTITGSKALSALTYELQHCKEEASSAECQTTGAEAGHVVLTGSASLFYIKKAEERVALVLTLNEAKITCGTNAYKARGALVIRVTPVGLKTTRPVLTLTRNGEAFENTYTSYENEKGEVIAAKLELQFGTGFKKGMLVTGALQPTANKALTVEG
jgi:hypothetical protein